MSNYEYIRLKSKSMVIDPEVDIEEKINNIFINISYINDSKDFEYLTLDMVTFFIHYCKDIRRKRIAENAPKDNKLDKLEKDLRWLKAIMMERGINKITR